MEDSSGQEVDHREVEADAEVQGPRVHPLPSLRAAARVPARLRYVPHLLPRAGAVGADPGRREVELVVPEGLLHRRGPAAGPRPRPWTLGQEDACRSVIRWRTSSPEPQRDPREAPQGGRSVVPAEGGDRHCCCASATSTTTSSSRTASGHAARTSSTRPTRRDLRHQAGQHARRRVYVNHREIPRRSWAEWAHRIVHVRGLMTDREAREAGLGGEVMCQVW